MIRLPSHRETIVIMAKAAVPGRVKTRLCSQFTPEQAAGIHEAMLKCTLARVAQCFADGEDSALKLSLDDTLAPTAETVRALPENPWHVIDQGGGDLGERLAYVWRLIGGGPTIFLGSDSPDVPAEALRSIGPALEQAEVVMGPVGDGGYWTIAGRRYHGQLFGDVDWGSADVYHQTRKAAEKTGLTVGEVQRWHDVDTPCDLQALRQRLASTREAALTQLRNRLDDLCKGTAR